MFITLLLLESGKYIKAEENCKEDIKERAQKVTNQIPLANQATWFLCRITNTIAYVVMSKAAHVLRI